MSPLPLLEDLPPLAGKRVLLRADFNVPLGVDHLGRRVIIDDFRIRATLPTIDYLLHAGASIKVCTHLGRPKGVDPELSIAPVAARLAALRPGVEIGENLRFSPGEEANDPAFVDELVAGFDCYVNDAFGVSHRMHASIVGPPGKLPSAAGRLVAQEVEVLEHLLVDPPRPFVAVVGGAKVVDKIGVLRALAAKVDVLVIGGGMSYTFLAALGHEIGDSLCDREQIPECEAILSSGIEVLLPSDIVAASADRSTVALVGRDIPPGYAGLDIGPESAKAFANAVGDAKAVFWNGPMGVFEEPRFSNGTRALADAVAACAGFTVVGGGDSASALDAYGLASSVDYVSSGGGASLEFIEFGDLPGLEALRAAFARRHGHG